MRIYVCFIFLLKYLSYLMHSLGLINITHVSSLTSRAFDKYQLPLYIYVMCVLYVMPRVTRIF